MDITGEEYTQHFDHYPCSLHGRTLEAGREQARWTINRAGTATLTTSDGGTRLLACDTCTALFGAARDAPPLWPDGARIAPTSSAADVNPADCPPLPQPDALGQALRRAEPVGYLRYSRALPHSDCRYAGELVDARGSRLGQWTLESSGRAIIWLDDRNGEGPDYRYCPHCVTAAAKPSSRS